MTAWRSISAFLAAALILSAGMAPAALVVMPPVQVGVTSSNSLRETSGVAASRSMPGILWMHNDSGDVARFFSVTTAGVELGVYSLSGATAVDWEDIAMGPKPGGGNYLYLGDIGDNDKERPSISIYRTTEPTTPNGGTILPTNYDKAVLQYPGGARNSESLIVDPLTGEMIIVTKSPNKQVYSAPASAFDNPAQITTLTALGTLNAALSSPSGADISPDGRMILVRDRSTTAYLWQRDPSQTVWQALQGPAIAVTLAAETQGEAIGWAADGSGFYTTSEWDKSGPRPIYFYSVSVPEPSSMVLGIMGLTALAMMRRRKR